MLTIKQQLELDGYVVLEDFLREEECDEMVEAAYELAESLPMKNDKIVFSTKEENQLQTDYFIDSNDKIQPFFEDKALDKDGNLVVEPRLSLNKVGHALHLLHPLYRCYTYCDRVKSTCKALGFVNPAVVQSMVIYKNPGIGSEVIPHQDATFLYTEPTPPVGFWIALEDATIQNGCLWISIGSHKSGVHRRLTRNPDNDSKQKLIYDKPAAVYPSSNFTAIPVKKGTCIILHGHVVHKSESNKTDKSRLAYTFHVIEKRNNSYSPDNWLQEGANAPFQDMYPTLQLM